MNFNWYRYQLGDFECFALRDGSFNYPRESLFANAPGAQLNQCLHEHGLPLEHVVTPYTCLLVDTGQHRVLIDTGAGNIAEHATKVFPSVDHSTTVTGQLTQNIMAAGIQPDSIDVVLITHAHPDHVGGNLNDAGELVFRNAHYFIAKQEWQFWTSDAADVKAPASMVHMARRNLEPLQDRLTLVGDADEVVPGITILATPGHTPGHIAVSISSGAEHLLHVSDVVLHPLHLEHPDWLPVFDIDPQEAQRSKRMIFDKAADEQLLLFAHHFPPFPNLGHVLRKGPGWKWQPVKTTA